VGSHKERNDKQLNPFALENKLGAVAAARELCPSSPSISSHGNSSGVDSDAEQVRRRRMKAKEFELHRKAHYNEMEALRRWKMSHQDDDDDDDDE
jgi:protein phosphatase inhibitor 2